MTTTREEQTGGTANPEVYLKLDSRNRITLKAAKADYYRAEVNVDGVITLKPCAIQEMKPIS